MAQREENWTTRKLLGWTTRYFEGKGIEPPRLAAEMLLAHVLGTKRLKLYMDPDRPASDLERAAFRELVERAVAHEPVDYLVGHSPFFSLTFKVTPDVLIPRPSTETLVEQVLQHARQLGRHAPAVADLGTGSGAIAVAVAKHLPGCRVIATDRSAAALNIARENAQANGVADRIDFRAGDEGGDPGGGWYEPIAGMRFDYLCSNPPYISDAEWADVPPNVKDHEPTEALRAGADGLDDLRPLIAGARLHLTDAGQALFEIAASQKQAAIELAEQAQGLSNPHVLADHEALPRVLVANAG